MKGSLSFGLICFLLLVSLAGVCMAEKLPAAVVYIQGGESEITNGSDGMTMITMKDVVPYLHMSYGNKSYMMPVQFLSTFTYPLNTVVVFSGAEGESSSLVEISNLSLSDGNKTLTLQVIPLEFYEGERLKSFTSEKKSIVAYEGAKFMSTGIYVENRASTQENMDFCIGKDPNYCSKYGNTCMCNPLCAACVCY